ncbi:MAG TPA: family 10 glycosylhydrolase [bacterium]|nr:family 10 glycosylhydrolase [bacterium]HPN42249.1 family 10 glycosylhydrolase [bacterium]
MPKTTRIINTLFLFVITFFVFTGNLFPRADAQTRTLWVTRWDYKTPDDIKKIVENAGNLNFNVILLQVRGNATVAYPSHYEGWSKEFDFRNPGWDPLQLAVKLAHERNIECHAWINVYPGWGGVDLPPASHLYYTHRDWFMIDEFGNPQQLNSHYIWLSPTHPQVKEYLLKICRELYTNYDIDGLHLDYVRFPGNAYSYDPESVKLFNLKTGTTPADRPFTWNQWRRDAVSSFIADLYNDMKSAKPNLVLSASVMGDYNRGLQVFMQDSHNWLAQGIVDVIYPMIYTTDNLQFQRMLQEHLVNAHNRHIYPGIMCDNSDQIRSQVTLAQELSSEGSALFSYSLVCPNHSPDYAISAALKTIWTDPAATAPLPWKKYYGDSQGPTIDQVKTIPDRTGQNKKFKIAAHIVDPSGVFDDNTGSNGQGIYLVYDRTWPPTEGTQIKMSRIKNSQDWYITDKAIPQQKAGLDFRYRIFAWDNYYESAGHPKRNLGFSDVWSVSILLPEENYLSAGKFGPVIWQPADVLVDHNNQIWAGCAGQNPLVIMTPDGTETKFSPLRAGIDELGNSLQLSSISSMTCTPDGVICVIDSQYPFNIYRFNTTDGAALPGLKLTFAATALDCDARGNLFILERRSTRWHILDAAGTELYGSPLGGGHAGFDIAVLEDGSSVFINDMSTNTIQQWNGAVEVNRARFWRSDDLPAVDFGSGGIKTFKSKYVYTVHNQRGIVTIFDRTGYPVEHLSGGNPPLHVPQNIGLAPDGKTLYVLESVGEGPTRLSKWTKKNR